MSVYINKENPPVKIDTKWQRVHTQFIGVSIFVVLLCLVYVVLNQVTDPDEVESIGGASLIFDGYVPYKDFWQIHTPLFYYFLAPLCFFFQSMKIIYVARLMVLCLLLLNGYIVYQIIKLFFSPKAGLLGTLSYFVCLPVLSVEARPDILVVLFSNLSLFFLLWQRLPVEKSFFLSGLSAALALLSKQSGLFSILSIVTFFVFRSLPCDGEFWDKTIFSQERFNIRNYCFFAVGLLMPCVGFYLLLQYQGAFNAFLQCAVKNDFLNSFLFLKVDALHCLPYDYLNKMVLYNFPLFGSAVVLFLYMIYYRKRVDVRKLNAFVLVLIFFAISFGALFFILHPWSQEFLLVSQYLVLLAVPLLVFIYERTFNFFEQKDKEILGVTMNLGMLLCICLPPILFMYKEGSFTLSKSIKQYDQIISLTNRNDKCCSYVPVPFRRNVYFARIGSILLEAPRTIRQVENSLIEEILRGNVVVFVESCVYDQMKRLESLIKDHYILYDHSFYAPGKILKAEMEKKNVFDMPVEGYYRITVEKESVWLDGKPIRDGVTYLKKGQHIIYFPNSQGICLINYDFQANKKGS